MPHACIYQLGSGVYAEWRRMLTERDVVLSEPGKKSNTNLLISVG
jgi:hypothetical protein